jgi:hypothetical protein
MAKTVIADIKNSAFPKISITPDTFVVWRNQDPFPHAVETLGNAPYYFNPGALQPGESSSPVYFSTPGNYPYLCRFHAGMEGVVTVTDEHGHGGGHGGHGEGHAGEHEHGGHGGHGLQHLHGFVTGGRSGRRMYMTHTPVIADPRHRFQVILQGSLIEPAHVAAYDAMRQSDYGDGRVQIFHQHLSLVDIGNGVVKDLPKSVFEYYPDPKHPNEGAPIPGLPEEEETPVRIDRVIHFHTFQPDTAYPDGMAYLVYGDEDDIFIDHYIGRAPSFHSVAKLKTRPSFWTGVAGPPVKVLVPSKRIRDVSPREIRRIAFVDNAFHLFWLLPPGAGERQAQDPLRRRDDSAPIYDVVLEDGRKDKIEIGRFLHFDIRLLNYGVFIV